MQSVIILASGFAVRMAQEKLLLPVEGVPVIRRVVASAAASRVDEIILIYRREEVKAAAGEGVDRALYNPGAHEGQSEAIRLGLRHLHPKSSACLFVMGDQPLISADVINTLIRVSAGHPATMVVPVYGTRPGSPVLFPKAFWQELMKLRGDESGRKVIRAFPDRVLKVPVPDDTAGLDVDTWDDYQSLLAICGSRKEPGRRQCQGRGTT